MDKVFNTEQEIELLQGAYEEAENLRSLAWDRVTTAMLAASPIKVGDMIELRNQYFSKNDGKKLRVKNTWVSRRPHVFRNDGPVEWAVRIRCFPIKKNGDMALVGERTVDDVEQDFKVGKIVLIPEIIDTK